MKRTICHITLHSAFDVRVFHKECVSLAQAGYDAHLIVPHDYDETVQGVHIHGLSLPASRLARLLLAPLKALRTALRIAPQPVIFHFHDPALLPVGVLLRLLTGARVIYDQHEDTPAQILSKHWIPYQLRKALSLAMRTTEALGLIGMGIIESDMIRNRNRQPKQSVRNLPIVPDNLPKRCLADFQGPPKLIYVGGISEDRGIWHMLNLAKGLREQGVEYQMNIIGPHHPPDIFDKAQVFIAKHNLSECVNLSTRIPHPEAIRLVANSTVGICIINDIPNYRYALPTKILEYMAYGLPVIASNLPCTRDYIEYCEGGILVDIGSPQQTLHDVIDLIRNPRRQLQMSIQGQQRIIEDLNWQIESQLLARFYERILGARTSPDPCWYHRR